MIVIGSVSDGRTWAAKFASESFHKRPLLTVDISKLLTVVQSIPKAVPPLLITALTGGVNDSPGGSNT